MNIQRQTTQRGKIVSGGRLQLPVEFRRQMGIADGDAVVMEVRDGALVITPYREVLKRVRERLRPYAPKDGTLVSDELIADRRAEAERE
jgi:bifunctional DNA-binding transcriptional regulator/antitoxin component of YhaV-PrlF toxin-antitoxin module